MALVKYSTASLISGKVGGNVYARNRYGNYVRSWSVPVNPNSNAQQAVRLLMAAANAAWSALTTVVQQDWSTYAAAVPWLNRIGETVYLTGKTMFVRTYVARLMAGLTMVAAAPSDLTLPAAPGGTFTATASTALLSYAWTVAEGWTAVGGALSVYATAVVAPTVNFIGQASLQGSVLGASTAPTTPQTVAYASLTNQAGNRVRVSGRILLPDGRVSSLTSMIVTIG
jgi:hypothetical protein